MQNDSKLIAEAYFKKLSENMSFQQPAVDEDAEVHLKNKLKHLIQQSSLTDAEKNHCMRIMGMDEDEENNFENDRTDQHPHDKSAIDHAREDKAAAERDKWTQGQGVGGKYHF